MPRWFNVLVPKAKVMEGIYPIAPGVIFSRANAAGTLDIDGVPQSTEGYQDYAGRNMEQSTRVNDGSDEKVVDERQQVDRSLSQRLR